MQFLLLKKDKFYRKYENVSS